MTTTTSEKVLEGIKTVLAEVLLIGDEKTIRPNSRLEEDLGMGSLDMLQIGLEIEQKFNLKNCRLKHEEVPQVINLVAYVEFRLGLSEKQA